MRKLLLLLVVFIALATWTGVSRAQTDGSTVGLSIRPAIVEIAGDPNTNHASQVIIENTSDRAIPVTVEVTSLIPIEDELDRSRRGEFDASSWVKLDQENLLLEPGESTPVKMTINIPQEANPGGHYAQVGFRVLSEATYDPKTNAQIIPEVAAALFITVSGDVNELAEFDTSDMISGYVTKGAETKIKFAIKNIGNVHILPAPKVTILDRSGNTVKQLAMQPQLVLPNTQKLFEVEWPADVGYGKYSVKVETVYGSQNIPLASESTKFVVGPAWWQVAVVVAIVTPLLIIFARKRHLPNAIKALRGKRIHLVGKSRYSKASNDVTKTKPVDTVGDYDTISKFLEPEAKPERKLQTPVYPVASAVRATPEPTPKSIAIEEAMQKTVEEPIEEVSVSQKATVTEVIGTDDKDSKTIIVQTSASTIIRQEPKQEVELPATPPPTIIRQEQPKKPSIKINITDGAEPKVTTPAPVKPKPKAQLTRAEQVAKKAAAAKRKSKKLNA